MELDIDKLILQESEVSDVKYLHYSKLELLFDSEDFVYRENNYRKQLIDYLKINYK